MRAVAFDVWGPFAHFRKPYAPLSPVTYPLPPPTAVLGLIGAICGFGKREYAERIGWREVRVGVQLLAPLSLYRTAINLLNTKDGTDAFFRPQKAACHMQVPHEFLRDPRFRIFVAGARLDALEDLLSRLRDRRCAYTPTLGLANCLAEVALVSEGELEELDEAGVVHSAVPLQPGVTVNYPPDRAVQRFRVPAEMDRQRVVHRYQEIAVATDGGPLEVSGVQRLALGTDPFCFI